MKKTNVKDSALFFARLEDYSKQCIRYQQQVTTSFFNEEELVTAIKYLGKKHLYQIDGGYPNARRARIAFLYYSDVFESEVVCLVAKINQKFVKISHSDVLGALMALDIERSHFGDLFILEDKIVIYVSSAMAQYVCEQCTQIHKLKIVFKQSDEALYTSQQFEEQSINVASLRLDNVVGAIVPCSRKIAQELIKLNKVSINHEIIEDYSKLCHNNNVISISGSGRYILVDDGKTSRKDRHIVTVKKYL